VGIGIVGMLLLLAVVILGVYSLVRRFYHDFDPGSVGMIAMMFPVMSRC
jgi:hypothetical protein